MSKSEYSTEVQEGIDEFVKAFQNKEFDANKVAQFLVENMGNSALNAQLRRELNASKKISAELKAKETLAYYLFKSQAYETSVATLEKINLVSSQVANGMPVEEFEKPNISEFGALETASKAVSNMVFKRVYDKTTNSSFKMMYSQCRQSSVIYKKVEEIALRNAKYNAGDLMMYLTSKTTALKGRQSDKGHEGKLEEKYVTKYNHAAPVFIDRFDPNNPTIAKSDIWARQRNSNVTLHEILESDSFTIDPTKLVSKEHARKLEKIDYGNKQDKEGNELKDKDGHPIKITWQEVMQERYRILSQALQEQQNAYMIRLAAQEKKDIIATSKIHQNKIREIKKEIKPLEVEKVALEKKIKEYDTKIKAIGKEEHQLHSAPLSKSARRKKIQALHKKRKKLKKARLKLHQERDVLQVKYKPLMAQLTEVRKKERELDAKLMPNIEKEAKLEGQKLVNDGRRLGRMSHWVVPAVTDLGHKKMRGSDMRKLSEKMFYATQDKRKMICSEFSARSIAASIDQLSRLTSMDLQASGFIDKEQEVVKNPIPPHENFNKLHPERLVKLLKQAKCIKKLHNKGLERVVQTENTSRAKPEKIVEILPRKLYAMVEKAESTEKFQKNAKQAMRLYLKHAKAPADKIDAAMQGMDKQLDKIYKQYTKQPSGIKEQLNAFCNKVLEAVGLRTKDKEVKVALQKTASHAFVSSMRKKQSLRRTASSKCNISASDARNTGAARVR